MPAFRVAYSISLVGIACELVLHYLRIEGGVFAHYAPILVTLTPLLLVPLPGQLKAVTSAICTLICIIYICIVYRDTVLCELTLCASSAAELFKIFFIFVAFLFKFSCENTFFFLHIF